MNSSSIIHYLSRVPARGRTWDTPVFGLLLLLCCNGSASLLPTNAFAGSFR